MGIESRDYLRHESGGRNYGSFRMTSGGWAIKYLIIANVIVFVLQNVSPAITESFALQRGAIFPAFQIWRFVTYGFCHSTASLGHLFFNMYVLWMFGRSVEPILGSREFLAFYLLGIVISGICHTAISPYPVIGGLWWRDGGCVSDSHVLSPDDRTSDVYLADPTTLAGRALCCRRCVWVY